MNVTVEDRFELSTINFSKNRFTERVAFCWNALFYVWIHFFQYIALISAFAAQMALLGFIFSSLYLSRNVSPYGRGLFPCMSEREVRRKNFLSVTQKLALH